MTHRVEVRRPIGENDYRWYKFDVATETDINNDLRNVLLASEPTNIFIAQPHDLDAPCAICDVLFELANRY